MKLSYFALILNEMLKIDDDQFKSMVKDAIKNIISIRLTSKINSTIETTAEIAPKEFELNENHLANINYVVQRTKSHLKPTKVLELPDTLTSNLVEFKLWMSFFIKTFKTIILIMHFNSFRITLSMFNASIEQSISNMVEPKLSPTYTPMTTLSQAGASLKSLDYEDETLYAIEDNGVLFETVELVNSLPMNS